MPPTDIHFLEVVDGAVVVVGRSYLAVVTRYGDTGHRLLPHLEKPSVLSVALCLTQAIREKWLAARNLSHAWPMFGRPRLFADLERCVPLAIVNHNLQENPKMLKVPFIEWQYNTAAPTTCGDEPSGCCCRFCRVRQLSP
jgi:hypothetical protein